MTAVITRLCQHKEQAALRSTHAVESDSLGHKQHEVKYCEKA